MGILLTIAAIAIPAVIASAQSGNETASVHNLRQVVTAQTAYRQLNPKLGYANSIAALGGPTDATKCPNIPDLTAGVWSCLLPDAFATTLTTNTAGINGYLYVFTGDGLVPSSGWTMTATPVSASSGRRSYYVDQSGSITWAPAVIGTPMAAPGTAIGQ